MQVLGRILQVVGWLWVAVGFFGPILNLPVDLDFFPGIILVFVARILRAQAARYGGDEEDAAPAEAVSQPVEVKSRVPRTEIERRPPPEPRPAEPSGAQAEAKRKEMLGQILLTGTEAAAEATTPTPTAEPTPKPKPSRDDEESGGTTGPLSSAEMIAQARKRWNKS